MIFQKLPGKGRDRQAFDDLWLFGRRRSKFDESIRKNSFVQDYEITMIRKIKLFDLLRER